MLYLYMAKFTFIIGPPCNELSHCRAVISILILLKPQYFKKFKLWKVCLCTNATQRPK